MEIATTVAPIALALIMLGLGMSLTINDFVRVIKNPNDFMIGLLCQLIILPIVAYLLLMIINLPIELAVGVMLIAAAPGGVTSNVLTKFCDGDVALSISLTAIISLISIISVPFIIFSSMDLLNFDYDSKNISMTSIALKMFFVVTVPVILGMVIRRLATDFIINNSKLIQKVSVILFIIVFAAIWIEEWDNVLSFITRAGTIALCLNLIMMTIGFYVAKFFTSGLPQQKCISLECGLQNGTLAAFVGTQLFDKIVFIVPAAAYALVMMTTSIIFVLILRKQS
tara:strand:- start:80 stop:928 length:849 start_codon:yes stop_codon:yes gene_type:complete